MNSLRTGIIHHTWLMVFSIFALLVQIQQVIACDMMIDVSAPPVSGCFKHNTGENPVDKTSHPCCDYSDGFLMQSGYCHDGHETVNNPYSGKPIPDIQLLVTTVSIQEIYPLFYQNAVQYPPADNYNRPGTATYLTTQRLRI